MDLVLGRVESTSLSDSSTCALYPQAMRPLVKGCTFCHLEFVSLGKEPSVGPHGQGEGNFVVVDF